MKRHSFAAHLALAALAVLGLASSAAAAAQVPFKGSLDGVVTHTPIDALHDQVEEGTVTRRSSAVHANSHRNHANGTAIGSYEFTAANGDTLFGDFTGQATPTATPGVLYIVEMVTITGGTGRFAGASGSFICERLFDRIAGTTSGSFEGTISSPGADNP